MNTDENQKNESSNQNSTSQELIVNNSGTIEQNQNVSGISSPTRESVSSTLDKSIDTGNSRNLNDQEPSMLEAENVVCMNPGGIVPSDDQIDVNNLTQDINLKSDNTPNDAGQKHLEQIKEDSHETNEALETENQGLNSTNIDNKQRLETKNTTISEPVAPPQCGTLEGAETQTQNDPTIQNWNFRNCFSRNSRTPTNTSRNYR